MNNEEQSATDLEIVAVIAAVVAAVLNKPHRVISVQRVVVPALDMNVWAFEGRVEHSMSHRIR